MVFIPPSQCDYSCFAADIARCLIQCTTPDAAEGVR